MGAKGQRLSLCDWNVFINSSSSELMPEPLKYKTIAAPVTADFRDRGSKFHAYAYPIKAAAEVKDKVQALKKEHPKAVHHCLAWRLGTDGSQFRMSDDG